MKIFFAFAMLVMGCSNETRGKEVVQALFKLAPDATQEERVKVCKDLVNTTTEAQAKQYAVEIAFASLLLGNKSLDFAHDFTFSFALLRDWLEC